MRIERPYILIADDDPDDQELLADRFHRLQPAAGIECLANGYQVLDYLRNCLAADLPVVLILDYKMPGITGAEVLQAIQHEARYRDLPKVVWSTSNNQEYIDLAMNSGADKYFTKPHDMQNFDKMARYLSDLFQSRL